LIDAVVFDLDGTLVNLPINYEELFQEFSKIMNKEDIHPVTETISRLDEETRKKIFAVWSKAENAALKDMTINDEGMALYKRHLTKPKALVTMQGRELIPRILKPLDLSFDVIVTREDSLDRVDQLRTAAQNLNVQFQNLLFIGNTEGDLLAAEKVKCQFQRVRH
jgi:HAD superfamily hydrolase (TIGR01549 family)